uniref:NAD-dependent epimerase/dehydratase n=1 Tax=Solibacter usitatus (strain Ellin6076) TaxID=234267 RepID=Q02BA7_SOLUE
MRKIASLRGPILVLGASGFVGANLLRMLLEERSDVYGTAFALPAWRLEGIPKKNLLSVDLLVPQSADALVRELAPATVFDFVAFGAYSFERDVARIYETNVTFKVRLLELLRETKVHCYIHAGSSSEYGNRADRPTEDTALLPNSHYSVTKSTTSGLIYYAGQSLGVRCANLRLYSVYGPMEERSRLVPSLIVKGLNGEYPPLVDPAVSRDFIYIDDACEAFVDCALNLTPTWYGESFNIGTGTSTTIGELAEIARDLLHIDISPPFSTMPKRLWDTTSVWCADASRATQHLGWSPRTTIREGLQRTIEWYRSLPDKSIYERHAKGYQGNPDESVSAVVACYKDGQAIPIMYQRLVQVFEKLHIDYEIIFVNDGSPDNSQEIIQQISNRNHRVLGITHSRNFGSQSAFRSGMELSSKRSCVLLDGDLQDPPELIEQFVEKWREGYDVVYGTRVKRDAPPLMRTAYRAFYLLFNRMSYVYMPRDAGDFSLVDRRVVRWLLECKERDLFLRGLRAFVGFRQTGVDYLRPERMFGHSTNNLLKNLGWAKKGILSFSNVPLSMLTSAGTLLFAAGLLLGFLQALARVLFPNSAPRGITTIVILILIMGALNLLAISVVGEYIAKIFEEVKRRPHFIRMNIIQNGEIRRTEIQKGE